jgi:hypothetical protein
MQHTTGISKLSGVWAGRFVSLARRFYDWLDMNFKKLRQLVTVDGNGQVTEWTLPVSSFLRLHLAMGGTYELIMSEEEKIVVRTDDNLQRFINVANWGRTLYISNADSLRIPNFTTLHIQIFIRQLDNLYIAHSGGAFEMSALFETDSPLEVKIQSDGNVSLRLAAPTIKLLSQTSGNVHLDGRCQILTAKVQNDGDFDARDMIAQQVEFTDQSNGNAWLYASESLKIRHYANGFIHYFGAGRVKEIKRFGNGEVRHIG